MLKLLKGSLFLFVLFVFHLPATAQDSLYAWSISSKKIDENKYELIFSTNGVPNYQLYAPDQVINEVRMAELSFNDSSISNPGNFKSIGKLKTFKSHLFETDVSVYEGPVEWRKEVNFSGAVPAQLSDTLGYYFGDEDEFQRANFIFTVNLEGGVASTTRIKVGSIDINKPVNECGDAGTKDKSIYAIFLLGILGGFIALLTPCVFPMIPLTVSFFTKKTENKSKGIGNAVLYGFFIFLIYVLLTIPFHIAGKTNPEIFNNISTNVPLNIIFFLIFVVFALSFFGLFELTLPSGLAGKADSKSGLGNWAGIFFMALTLAIVSFSCTGPILGTLLTGVAEQGAWPLTAGAAGFGLALGLPFALFALFPNWLQSIPKSGGWLTDVKIVLGFIELALAVKFFANADNVKQWGIMKREVFVALWVIIGFLIVLYLSGKLKFGHSGPVKKFSATRLAFLVLFSLFTLYLIPGLTNSKWAYLKMLSGFPPPLSYSVYKHHILHVSGVEPLVNDYEKALALAKKENKPVLIDFTGWACVNCRRMEEKVWTDHVVDSLMRTEFIVVSLYVDERTKLPLTEQTTYKTSSGIDKSIITVGDKWATFQTENFGATSQPQYAILSADEKALTKTKFYTPNADEFAEWLRCGIDAYKKNIGQ